MKKRSLEDVDVRGKPVLVRVDFNVPVERGIDSLASYDHRLRVTLPTIQHLIEHGSKIILCSHLGRPMGKVVEALRMAPVGRRLSALLSRPVKVLSDCIGSEVERAVSEMSGGDILMLENLRFHPGEEENDPEFARALASPAELFVMDAFAVAHRAHASTVGVPKHLPSAAGCLLQRELEQLGRVLDSPERPMAAVLGGAKVSDKIVVLENLLHTIDRLFIGGGMAATFLKAQGHATGSSLVEDDKLEFASRLLNEAHDKGISVHIPTDVVISDRFGSDSGQACTVPVGQVPEGWYIMDIGAASVEEFVAGLHGSKTVMWNGPMGVFEYAPFAEGTRRIGYTLAAMNAITLLGGGSTAEVAEELGITDKLTHVSTGGGASLGFLEGKELPGIAALPDAG